jgi:hypothetical protein
MTGPLEINSKRVHYSITTATDRGGTVTTPEVGTASGFSGVAITREPGLGKPAFAMTGLHDPSASSVAPTVSRYSPSHSYALYRLRSASIFFPSASVNRKSLKRHVKRCGSYSTVCIDVAFSSVPLWS